MRDRKAKIQPQYRRLAYGQSKIVPKLSIGGNWLERAGFSAKSEVLLKVEIGKITILPVG